MFTRPQSRRVFVCLPAYAEPCSASVRAAFQYATKGISHVVETKCSLLAQGFNIAWCDAITRLARGEPVTHFAMLHADIEPEAWWVDTLIDEMELHGADVISTTVPIKTPAGLSSAGIARKDTPWQPLFRLTMRQAMELPATFDAGDCGHPDKALLVNTGCWVCRLDPSWAYAFPGFGIVDRIVKGTADDGGVLYRAEVEPEDWRASRAWHDLGLKVVGTRKVKVWHHGRTQYPNFESWGMLREDDGLDKAEAQALSVRLGLAG